MGNRYLMVVACNDVKEQKTLNQWQRSEAIFFNGIEGNAVAFGGIVGIFSK